MKKMSGTLKLDLALYREMAAFSSFGFDESTQELLRRGAALTEMLKQQQFRPLPSEIQVVVLFNGIRERITPKQIRFYEYQVVPNLIFGLNDSSKLSLKLNNAPVNTTTISLALLAITESLLNNPQQTTVSKLENKKALIQKEILAKSDNLCTYVNLLTKQDKVFSQTYLYNLSFLLIKMALKYKLFTKKASKNVDDLFNILTTFHIGG